VARSRAGDLVIEWLLECDQNRGLEAATVFRGLEQCEAELFGTTRMQPLRFNTEHHARPRSRAGQGLTPGLDSPSVVNWRDILASETFDCADCSHRDSLDTLQPGSQP